MKRVVVPDRNVDDDGAGEGGKIINEREPRYCRVAERYAMMDRVEIIGASLSFSSLERRIMKHL